MLYYFPSDAKTITGQLLQCGKVLLLLRLSKPDHFLLSPQLRAPSLQLALSSEVGDARDLSKKHLFEKIMGNKEERKMYDKGNTQRKMRNLSIYTYIYI